MARIICLTWKSRMGIHSKECPKTVHSKHICSDRLVLGKANLAQSMTSEVDQASLHGAAHINTQNQFPSLRNSKKPERALERTSITSVLSSRSSIAVHSMHHDPTTFLPCGHFTPDFHLSALILDIENRRALADYRAVRTSVLWT